MLTSTEDIPPQVNDSTVLLDVQQWGAYCNAGLITEKDLELLDRYDRKPLEEQLELFDAQSSAYATLFLNMVEKINKAAPLRYTLALISQLVTAGRSSAFLAASRINPQFPWSPFEKVLKRSYSEFYLNATAAALMARLIEEANTNSQHTVADDIVSFLFTFLDEQLHKKDTDSARVGCLGLRPLLSVEAYRRRFCSSNAANSGIDVLCRTLRVHSKSVQLVYEAAYCLWLVTFSSEVIAEAPPALVHALVDCVRHQKKEKVLRVCLAALTALCGYGVPRPSVAARALEQQDDEDDADADQDDTAAEEAEQALKDAELDIDPAVREAKKATAARHAEAALDAGLWKPLTSMRARRWADQELASDIETLSRALARSVRELSSFEKYKKEVYSGQLEWSPAHKSETFWHENVENFEDQDYRLIKTLKLLAKNPNSKISSIACYDLGEFARVHPNGKDILEKTGAKDVLINLMSTSKTAEVQKQALFAVQKVVIRKYDLMSR